MNEVIAKINKIENDMSALLQAQQISNYLAISNNVMVPESMRQEALNRAISMMGLNQSINNSNDLENGLPTNMIL